MHNASIAEIQKLKQEVGVLMDMQKEQEIESIISKLGIEDALKVEDGSETVEEDYILFTYTDGFGDVPYEVDEFLQSQSEHLKGVVVSGDTGYGEAYCKAGDVIAEQYNVPCLYKVENDGSDEDIEAIKKVIA